MAFKPSTRWALITVVAACVALACTAQSTVVSPSPAVSSATPATSSATPATSSATPATSSATPATTATTSPLVGEWRAVYHCRDVFTMLHTANLDEFLIDAIYGNQLIPGATPRPSGVPPDARLACTGAIEVPHYHFFTADGHFGSRDFARVQVDEGTYAIDGDQVDINGRRFRFTVTGDELRLEPPKVDISGCATQECRFAAAWVLMVALPGSTWTRQ